MRPRREFYSFDNDWIGMVESEGLPQSILPLPHRLLIMLRIDFDIMNGGYVDINQNRVQPPAHGFGPPFTTVIVLLGAFSPLSYFYMAFKNEIGF